MHKISYRWTTRKLHSTYKYKIKIKKDKNKKLDIRKMKNAQTKEGIAGKYANLPKGLFALLLFPPRRSNKA